jgi:hypothetical protein
MAGSRKHEIAIIAALVILVVAYASLRSELRLRSDMPGEFFDRSRFPRPASEEKIAKAYWECAVKQVQWKYGYAYRLPDEPPAEFSVSVSELGPVAKDDTVRRYYWQRLRATWNVSSAWQTQYEWSSVSFRQSLRSSGDWWKDLVQTVVGK